MRAWLRTIVAALCGWLCLSIACAHAAALSPDPTGMWYDPANPGWGLSVTQQGETIFAALFVYDANHKPVWYVASKVIDSGTHLDPIGSEVFTGALFRTTGPWLGNATFDPNAVTVTPVGNLGLARGVTAGTLLVSYSIDALSVSTSVQPQIWASAAPRLFGGYYGGVFLSSGTCEVPVLNGRLAQFGIGQGEVPGHMFLTWGTGIDTGCILDGTFAQSDQTGTLSGPFSCGPIGGNLSSTSTLTLSEIVFGAGGFSAAAKLQTPQCTFTGNAGGALSPNATPIAGSMHPDPTGMWFDSAAPGYGLSLTQQGANIFGVLFAYGTDNKAQWLVASNVVDAGQGAFAGPLYRTLGPAAGAGGDTTAFSVTNVGSLKLRYGPGASPFGANLVVDYTVDGTTVERILQRETWSGTNLTGTYTGGLALAGSGVSGCDALSNAGSGGTITITQSQGSMQIAWQPDTGTQCSVSGGSSPFGNLATFSGSGQCISNTTPATISAFSIAEMSVTPHGFSGTLAYTAQPSFAGGTCNYTGTIGGVRRQLQ